MADVDLAERFRALLASGDDYASPPSRSWTGTTRRPGEALVDSRARDGDALLAALDGRPLSEAVGQAARLLATVLGQDHETGPDGGRRIAPTSHPRNVNKSTT